MSADSQKYLHFDVALLKSSFALDALWQDSLKHHMVDQPGQLIALRLTEYYEAKAQGLLHPVANRWFATTPPIIPNGADGESATANQAAGDHLPPTTEFLEEHEFLIEEKNIVALSPDVEQNADEAAAYWSLL